MHCANRALYPGFGLFVIVGATMLAANATAAQDGGPSPTPAASRGAAVTRSSAPARADWSTTGVLPETFDLYSDTWVATDGRGRSLPTQAEAGPPRSDRFVGIFYFIWLGSVPDVKPWNVMEILRQDPRAMEKPDSPVWGPIWAPHHWGESIFGYYRNEDRFVLRKHAQMLSDAGVDTLIFDTSNGPTYREAYLALLQVFRGVRGQGGKTPQICFLTPFGDARLCRKVVADVFNDLYDGAEAWTPSDHLSNFKAVDGVLGFDVTGDGPGLLSPDNLSVDASAHRWLKLRLRNSTAGAEARILWTTYGDQRFENEMSKSFRISANDADFKEYTLDLGAATGWAGNIKQLRLDLAADARGHFDVAEIRLSNGQPSDISYLWDFGNYEDLSFKWEGKPLILADPEFITEPVHRAFFTFRKPMPDYRWGPSGANQWGWLEVYPQHEFKSGGIVEEVTVGVAQNAVDLPDGTVRAPSGFQEPNARGRSYYKGTRPPGDPLLDGFNFQQQWDHALSLDPRFIFITGWNEWIAARFQEFNKISAPVVFVDEFTEEYSRDAEPTRESIGDNYYYQMIAGVRRFKGVRPIPAASATKTIHIDGQFDEWQSVTPEFRDTIGDTAHRYHPGWGTTTGIYVNTSGRNDIVLLKAACDSSHVYFYVRTRDALTAPTGPHWMNLLLDIDSNHKTGWERYDYVVNRQIKDSSQSMLEKNARGWKWTTVGTAKYRAVGNEMELAIPLAQLPGMSDPPRFNFKWADNYQAEGDVRDFTLNGDSAPNDRFNYRFQAAER